MKKRIVCLFLGLTMLLSQNVSTFAATITEILQENNQTDNTAAQPGTLTETEQQQNQLLETKDTIDSLSEQQSAVQAQISDAYPQYLHMHH